MSIQGDKNIVKEVKRNRIIDYGIIVSIILAFIGGIFSFGSYANTVDRLESDVQRNTDNIQDMQKTLSSIDGNVRFLVERYDAGKTN